MFRSFVAAVALVAIAACAKKDDQPDKAVTAVDLPNVAPESGARSAGPMHHKVDQVAPPAGIDLAKPPADVRPTADGLVFKSLSEGSGPNAGKNDTVVIDYTGWHSNGDTFYSTKSRGKPLSVPLATSAVGFAEAIAMMKKGGHAVFWLPPEIGYKGKAQAGAQAPDTLVFDVTLVDIKPAPPIPADVAGPPAGAQKTPKGVAFVVVKPGTGKDKARYFDNVSFHYTGWTSDGRMFDTTETRGQPRQTAPFRETAGLEDALDQLVVGERARFWIPPALTKGSLNAPAGTLCYEIELTALTPAPAAPPPVPADVAAPPKDAKKTAAGVSYKSLKPGDGKTHPAATDQVKVNYTGWTVDGRMFDSSVIKGQPATFPLGGVIKGWTDGIPLMTKGETMRFWIPVEMAYNHQPGKPDGMLVFDVELLDIVHGPPMPPGGPHGPHGAMMPPIGGPPGAPPPGHP